MGTYWGELMKLSMKFQLLVAVACAAACAGPVFAQRASNTSASARPTPGSYDIANDVSLQGTVLSYTENSATPPIGAHVLLQTASGNVDVHLGDARLLHLAKMNIAKGASVRFVGQMQTAVNSNSPVFFARLVQVGAQVLAVRSEHGFPLAPAGMRANKALLKNAQADQKGGAR